LPSPGIQSQRVGRRPSLVRVPPLVRLTCLSESIEKPVGPHGFGPPSVALVLRTGLRGVPDDPLDQVHKAPSRPPVDLGSAPEYDPRGPLPKQLPLVRFLSPTTLEARGSDLHRACLTRLCDAFRLLPPPGVSFLPRPSRLCFTPVTPLGFPLQRFAPLARPVRSLDRPAPPDVTRPSNAAGEVVRFIGRLPGRDRVAPVPSPLPMPAP
jgi:hypothetical protein